MDDDHEDDDDSNGDGGDNLDDEKVVNADYENKVITVKMRRMKIINTMLMMMTTVS